MDFVVPNVVPQDLLLIRDIIGAPEPPPKKPVPIFDDNIDSSDSENGSEDEIEADLVKMEDPEVPKPQTAYRQHSSAPSDSTSESDSDSDTDTSDSDDVKVNVKEVILDDDEDSGPAAPTAAYFQTKNELLETDVAIPDIDEVGPDEVLEKVGEGAPSDLAFRRSGQALDSDTLLVFEDRKVLGYVYETFGPTSQPLYQVKFSASYPIDPDKVQLSRPVFHVPQRSNFVYLNQIRRFKGSDASNMHDEEPADDELEFSDDEAEAAHKSSLKRKSERRIPSKFSCIVKTVDAITGPNTRSGSRFMERGPYDDHSPYDDNFGSGPSRPAPIPYDDPYSDEYNNVPDSNTEPPPLPPTLPTPRGRANSCPGSVPGRGRGRGRGDRGESRGRGRDRGGRGRGRGRGNSERGPGRRHSNDGDWAPQASPYDPHHPRPLSPTSLAIARATGQFADGSDFTGQSHSAPSTPTASWAFDPSHQFNFGYQQPFIQPHINPRFASAFGINFQPREQYEPHQTPPSGGSWTDEWTVHGRFE
ncbi:Gar1/Naf1 RNA binding region-domain-containing protein [Mycena rebaudengoi]|nr:Gar1/Naf1 RNA binding region-domain-containing protein [Mycena rebaudengoi]